LKKTQAVEKLYNLYAPAFYGHIKRTIYKTDISDSVLENTFNTILNSLPQFDASKETFFNWCFKICRKETSRQKVNLLLKELFTC